VAMDAQLRTAQQDAQAAQMASAATIGQQQGQLATLTARNNQLEVSMPFTICVPYQAHYQLAVCRTWPQYVCPVNCDTS
jgi:hypothetical protein